MVFDPRQQEFTAQAQAALGLSQQIVLQMKQNQWDSEHLLSGLLQVEDSLAAKMLEELNVDVADLVAFCDRAHQDNNGIRQRRGSATQG